MRVQWSFYRVLFMQTQPYSSKYSAWGMPPQCLCFRINHFRSLSQLWYIRSAVFHTGAVWRSDIQDQYKVLGLDANASASDIKKYARPSIPRGSIHRTALIQPGNSTPYPKSTTPTTIPTTPKPQPASSKYQKPMPSLAALKSGNAMIEKIGVL